MTNEGRAHTAGTALNVMGPDVVLAPGIAVPMFPAAVITLSILALLALLVYARAAARFAREDEEMNTLDRQEEAAVAASHPSQITDPGQHPEASAG